MPSPAFSVGHFHQNNMQEDAVVGCLFYLSLVLSVLGTVFIEKKASDARIMPIWNN